MVNKNIRAEFEKNYNSLIPEISLAALREKSIEASVIYDSIRYKPGDIVLFTGSYATEEFNQTSDVDILILTDDAERDRTAEHLNHPSIFGDSFDVLYKETFLNIEYIKFTEVAKLLSLVNKATALVHPDLPNLQGLELRLAQRIHNGMPLLGGKEFNNIKKSMNIDLFISSSTALSLIMAISFLEDSLCLNETDSRLILSSAAFCLVTSYVNSSGNITYSVKNLRKRALELSIYHLEYETLKNVDSLLFVSQESVPVGQRLVIEGIVQLIEILKKSELHHLTLKMVNPYIEKIPSLLNILRV